MFSISPDLKDFIEWDVLNWSQALVEWQPVINTLPKESKILAIGERNGGLSLWLALQGFNVECTDRDGPTEKAKALHKQYGVADKIIYSQFDIINTRQLHAQYDLIICKSVLGGLKEQYADATTRTDRARYTAVEHIYSLLQPGGYFLSADNMKGSRLLQYFRNKKDKNKHWHYFSIQELATLHEIFPQVSTKAFGILPTKSSNAVINCIFYIANKYLLRFLPTDYCYISFTIARK